jgi:hypothetical protein
MPKKYAKDMVEAKKIYKERTGIVWKDAGYKPSGVTIYKLKNQTPTRKYFVGNHMEWLNK